VGGGWRAATGGPAMVPRRKNAPPSPDVPAIHPPCPHDEPGNAAPPEQAAPPAPARRPEPHRQSPASGSACIQLQKPAARPRAAPHRQEPTAPIGRIDLSHRQETPQAGVVPRFLSRTVPPDRRPGRSPGRKIRAGHFIAFPSVIESSPAQSLSYANLPPPTGRSSCQGRFPRRAEAFGLSLDRRKCSRLRRRLVAPVRPRWRGRKF
jgi:hypothetical protein